MYLLHIALTPPSQSPQMHLQFLWMLHLPSLPLSNPCKLQTLDYLQSTSDGLSIGQSSHSASDPLVELRNVQFLLFVSANDTAIQLLLNINNFAFLPPFQNKIFLFYKTSQLLFEV